MKILSVQQAAERSGLAERTIRHHIETQSLPATRIGRSWIVAESDLKVWLKKDRKPGPRTGKK